MARPHDYIITHWPNSARIFLHGVLGEIRTISLVYPRPGGQVIENVLQVVAWCVFGHVSFE